jgi:hypothetical protein
VAGRFRGYHRFRDKDGDEYGSFEVFWQHNGWFWQLRSPGSAPDGEVIGPFTTSTEAYQSARGERFPHSRKPHRISPTRPPKRTGAKAEQ